MRLGMPSYELVSPLRIAGRESATALLCFGKLSFAFPESDSLLHAVIKAVTLNNKKILFIVASLLHGFNNVASFQNGFTEKLIRKLYCR